jgi:hypothetical protein
LKSRQLCSHSSTLQHFKKPEGSLQCSQELSTGPYPEEDGIGLFCLYMNFSQKKKKKKGVNPVHTTPYLLKIHFNIIHPHNLPSALFPSGFPTNILYVFLPESSFNLLLLFPNI